MKCNHFSWMDIKREFSAIVDSVEMYYNSESHVHLEQAKTEINDISTIISSPILVKRKERIITFLTNYFTEHNYCYSRIGICIFIYIYIY